MKRILLLVTTVAVLMVSVSSCVAGRSMKKDCQGNRHVRLKNGIYI